MDEPRVKLGAVKERPGFGNGGDLINFVDVPFTIESTGDSGLVSIPAAQFTAERAHTEVSRKVEEILKLRNAMGG